MKNQWISRWQTKMVVRELLNALRACRKNGVDPLRYNFDGVYRKYPRSKKINLKKLWAMVRGE